MASFYFPEDFQRLADESARHYYSLVATADRLAAEAAVARAAADAYGERLATETRLREEYDSADRAADHAEETNSPDYVELSKKAMFALHTYENFINPKTKQPIDEAAQIAAQKAKEESDRFWALSTAEKQAYLNRPRSTPRVPIDASNVGVPAPKTPLTA
jgi:hypothetical protein